jgi:hypothetical protein
MPQYHEKRKTDWHVQIILQQDNWNVAKMKNKKKSYF